MKFKNTHTVICGKTHPPVTTSLDFLKSIKPTERIIEIEDCPELTLLEQADLNHIRIAIYRG